MAEGQVSADGVTRLLPQPFVVLATDNPIEYEATYPLSEAQLDRFIARVRLGYLDAEGEAEMVRRRLACGSAPPASSQVTDAARLLAMRESLELVQLHPDLLAYVVALVAATCTHPQVTVGASPRGTLARSSWPAATPRWPGDRRTGSGRTGSHLRFLTMWNNPPAWFASRGECAPLLVRKGERGAVWVFAFVAVAVHREPQDHERAGHDAVVQPGGERHDPQ